MIHAPLIYTWFSTHWPLCRQQSLAQSENAYVQEDLNATLAYGVQIQCVTSKHCSQCDWSEVYIIPPGEVTLGASRAAVDCILLSVRQRITLSFSELTVAPVLVDVNETNFGRTSGRRLLTLAWEVMFPAEVHCCHPRNKNRAHFYITS